MSIFTQLQNNKGTISSALGKELAERVLSGNNEILKEAIKLVIFNEHDLKSKNIRAGAAKIVETVAEMKPDLVAPFLEELYPALDLPEVQTRWMIIRTMGFCAHLNQEISISSMEYAIKYIQNKEGLCLTSSAELYLGDIGALSEENAKTVFPILEEALKNALVNEVDWILEAYMKICKNLDKKNLAKIKQYINEKITASKKSTQNRIKKLTKMVNQQ